MRQLQRVLATTDCQVEVIVEPATLREYAGHDANRLVVVSADALGDPATRALLFGPARPGRMPLLVLASELAQLSRARLEYPAGHLIAASASVLPEELSVTLQKLLRRDLFGLEKYLLWGTVVQDFHLTHSDERGELVQLVTEQAVAVAGRRFASLAVLCADEILSNAIFNAPVDRSGEPPRNRDRALDRALAEGERVGLRFACDGRYLAIEAGDRFGSIDPELLPGRIAASAVNGTELSHMVRFDTPGSGIGLGLIYRSCSQLIVNLEPGRRGEFLCLIDVRESPQSVMNRLGSFSMFVDAGVDGGEAHATGD
jgi:hypothetical protein